MRSPDDGSPTPGEADPPRAHQEPRRFRSPGMLELEELLAARLATQVSVRLGKGGKLIVDFADLDDLERIYRVITPPGTVV
ncbi:MAG: hypothetical protein R2695_06640 [Acidimicrobiales bacterium]